MSADMSFTKCSICGESFVNIKECLKHELIKHSLQKFSTFRNSAEKRLIATSKLLKTDENIMERKRLKQVLSNCESGHELRKIFDLFCMKADNLDFIFKRIEACLEKDLQSVGLLRIFPFGSISSGLALRDCDIDIFMDASKAFTFPGHKYYNGNNRSDSHHRRAFNRITGLLYRSTSFTDVHPIREARVPIIKCKHKDTGFSIDINVSYPSSRENTRFIYDLINSDERIRELMLFIKLWGKNMQIVSRQNMTSYCLITMVIFFLQQPQKSAVQINNDDNRILKSMKELQENCPCHMVQGVNYAYDLENDYNRPKISNETTTWDLIKQFFDFYASLDFENNIISPYYGKLISKSNLASADIWEEYNKQMKTITEYWGGKVAFNLQTDRCICIQEVFCLNQNIAKNVSPRNKEYILLCLKNASKICENPQKHKLPQLCEQLLFETSIENTTEKPNFKPEKLPDLQNLKLPTVDTTVEKRVNNEVKLIHTLTPSKSDVRTLTAQYPHITTRRDILRCWCQHYICNVTTIITKLYRMDMQKQHPSLQKQLKLDCEEIGVELNQSWSICCGTDLWSNRCFQKNSPTSFMSCQLEQTEQLYNLRRQDPTFSVALNAILNLNILPNYAGIDIEVTLPQTSSLVYLNKKSPLRKFFNIFKNTLQNLTLKEVLIDAASRINDETPDTPTTTKNIQE